MAATLKIDGYDFFTYLRVLPGEGFDPASPGFAEPQFGEASPGDAQPLISVNERNKELAWPLHLNAASKTALHTLLADVNRRLASAQQVEWKDDGATNSTFFDVVFARFDPDYNYRRAQKNWLSGMLRVWVKPYGHTGTYRFIGSVMSPSWGLPPIVSIPSTLDGDTFAKLRVSMETTNHATTFATNVAGISVMPTAHFGFWAPASMNANAGGSVMAATTGIGSQALITYLGGNQDWVNAGINSAPSFGGIGAINNTSISPGRHHAFGVVRTQATVGACSGVAVYLWDYNNNLIGPTQTLAASTNWSVMDFGVFTQATQVASNPVYNGLYLHAAQVGASAGSATGSIQLCGLYLLPEDTTVIAKFTNQTIDKILTNPDGTLDFVRDSAGDKIQFKVPDEVGVMPQLAPATAGYKVLLFQHSINQRQNGHYDATDPHTVYAQERFTYAR